MACLKKALIPVLLAGACIGHAAMAADPDAIEPIHMPGRVEGWNVSGGVTQDAQGNLYGLVKNSNQGVFIDKYTRG